jgi:hypothetical protein
MSMVERATTRVVGGMGRVPKSYWFASVSDVYSLRGEPKRIDRRDPVRNFAAPCAGKQQAIDCRCRVGSFSPCPKTIFNSTSTDRQLKRGMPCDDVSF